MKTFLAVIAYALSLFGIDVGSKIRIDHIQDNGTDVLYSEVVAQPTGTRFECVRSASGQCYYTVIRRQCVSTPGTPAIDCTAQPAERFALAKGDSRHVTTLEGFRMCVSAEAEAASPDCK